MFSAKISFFKKKFDKLFKKFNGNFYSFGKLLTLLIPHFDQLLNGTINPIPAGVLENQDMLGGGGQFDPPL